MVLVERGLDVPLGGLVVLLEGHTLQGDHMDAGKG